MPALPALPAGMEAATALACTLLPAIEPVSLVRRGLARVAAAAAADSLDCCCLPKSPLLPLLLHVSKHLQQTGTLHQLSTLTHPLPPASPIPLPPARSNHCAAGEAPPGPDIMLQHPVGPPA